MTLHIDPTICAALKALPIRYEQIKASPGRRSTFVADGFPMTIREYAERKGIPLFLANNAFFRWQRQGKIRIAGARWSGKGNVLVNVYEVCV